METILKQEDTKELFEKLYSFPSLYIDLTPYQRAEVYQYAQSKLTERIVYWSGAIDFPVNIETAERAGYSKENVLEYFLSRDDTSRRARAVISLIENGNQKQTNTDGPANKPKSNLDWVIYFGLLYKQGKLKISDLTSGTLEAIIEGMAEKTKIEVPKKNRLARHIRGHSEYKQHGIFECPDDKWIFREEYFNKICKEDNEAYERALSFLNEIKYP